MLAIGARDTSARVVSQAVPPHEVVGDQLLAALKQPSEVYRPLRARELVVLDHLGHRQFAARGVHSVLCLGDLLLLGEQLLARGQPLIW
jgi:hypothetical protein